VSHDQIAILAILSATVAMFLWGRWRHDMVAAAALLACVLAGLVAPAEAFAGFGHPAVITVACVLVLSQALQNSGAVDALARAVLPAKAGPTLSIAALTALAAVLSGFMNNVGALALLMPVAIQLAGRLDLPPGKILMPLASGSILGGTMTLIGTPPNLIVSGFRNASGPGGFGMFDFTPVGAALTLVGVAFIALVGWRLVPARRQAGAEGFETGAYLTEARVAEGAKADGKTLREIEALLDEADAQVVGLVRSDLRLTAPSPGRLVRAGDILIIEAEVEALGNALGRLGLALEEDKREEIATRRNGQADEESVSDAKAGEQGEAADHERETAVRADGAPHRDGGKAQVKLQEPSGAARDGGSGAKPVSASRQSAAGGGEREGSPPSDEIALVELAVLPGSPLAGRSATDILLRTRFGINLLALSRQGRRSVARLRTIPLAGGDVLLMQGAPEAIASFAGSMACAPLASRALRIPDRRNALVSSVIMLVAVGVSAFGLLPAAVSFAAGVLASMALRTVPPRAVYDAVDWPVIVLLAALLPVAGAMQSTGAADLVARLLLDHIARGDAVVGLVVILISTVVLTDLMNNAATAAVMAPIALGTAGQLGANADPFLMAVAVGASCALLTPIGHQNNTLILGPGGFRFGDYWKMGLPLDVLVIVVAVPMLLLVWPL
jgi:di/tricarboxylate transporter